MWKKLNRLFLKLLSSNKSIVIVAVTDLLVDIAFCILYMTEFQVNASTVQAESTTLRVPYWLQVYRPQAIFRVAIAFSIWILCSFAVRVNYVRNSVILRSPNLTRNDRRWIKRRQFSLSMESLIWSYAYQYLYLRSWKMASSCTSHTFFGWLSS